MRGAIISQFKELAQFDFYPKKCYIRVPGKVHIVVKVLMHFERKKTWLLKSFFKEMLKAKNETIFV